MAGRDRSLVAALNELGESASWRWDKLPAQEQFLTTTTTFTCFSGGFGTGKTTALCAKIILLLTAIPNNLGYLGRLDGKSLRHSTLQTLLELLPKEFIKKHNEQQGLIYLDPDCGGSKLVYGDFKDINDLKNIPLGFFAIDQMEEVPYSVWEYLAGRIRRRVPVLTPEGLRQYYVAGACPRNSTPEALGRHYATSKDVATRTCVLCGAQLPPFSDERIGPNRTPAWDLIVYRRYGFGVCNPEGPSHWIYKTFSGLPGQHGISTGLPDHQAFHATIYDGLRAGFVDTPYVENLETLYAANKTMWDRYLLGKWVEAQGLVYPMWSRELHVVPYQSVRWDTNQPIVQAGRGHLFEYIDHGLTAATAVGWVYTEQCECGCNKTNYYLVDEHYEGGKTISYHAAQIKAHRMRLGNLPIQATYLDSQAFSKTLMGTKGTPKENELFSVADEYVEYDIYPVPTQKDWKVGYDRLSQLLIVDQDHVHPVTGIKGAPHFLVFNTCTNFIQEIETHKWRIVRNAAEPRQDEPADGHDHHMDGINGFLASRPADVIAFTPPAEPDWTHELDMFDTTTTHMAA